MSYFCNGQPVNRAAFITLLHVRSQKSELPVLLYEAPIFWHKVIQNAPWLLTWWRVRA